MCSLSYSQTLSNNAYCSQTLGMWAITWTHLWSCHVFQSKMLLALWFDVVGYSSTQRGRAGFHPKSRGIECVARRGLADGRRQTHGYERLARRSQSNLLHSSLPLREFRFIPSVRHSVYYYVKSPPGTIHHSWSNTTVIQCLVLEYTLIIHQ